MTPASLQNPPPAAIVKPVARVSPKIVPIYGIVFKNPAKIAIPTPAGTPEQHESDGVQHAHQHRNQQLPTNVCLKDSPYFIKQATEWVPKPWRNEVLAGISPPAEVHENVIDKEGHQEQIHRSGCGLERVRKTTGKPGPGRSDDRRRIANEVLDALARDTVQRQRIPPKRGSLPCGILRGEIDHQVLPHRD
jgi:hypothetical protein